MGTGGAHEMKLTNNKDFSAAGIDSEFGILNINLENDNNDNSIDNKNNIRILTGSFIQNEDNEEYNILDQFKITK